MQKWESNAGVDKEEIRHEDFEEEYIPRPRWQVWGARLGLILVLAAVALYYWSVANPF